MRLSRLTKIISLIILLFLVAAGLFLFPILRAGYADHSSATLPVANTAPATKQINLLFFGDLMLDRHVAEKLKDKNLDFILGGLASSTDFFAFDLVGANLEGAVTNQGEHYAPSMSYDFAFLPSRVAELKQYNFSYFTIANNHLTDQGETGLRETRTNLNNLGFLYSGDADAQISDNSVRIATLKDKKIAFVGLSMVYHNFDLEAAKKIIKTARTQADWVIINIHWGNEYQHQFNKYQQTIGRALIDSGADIIIGHHPHVVQGMEIYNNHPIFYSLGNFIFDQYFSPDTQQGLSLEINLTEAGLTIKPRPLQSEKGIVNLMAGDQKEKFLDNFASWSKTDLALKEQIKAQIINIAN